MPDRKPEQIAKEALEAMQNEAVREALITQLKAEKQPESLEKPYSDAATHNRMAAVYEETSAKLTKILTKHRRDLVRALSPHKLTDEQADWEAKELDIE